MSRVHREEITCPGCGKVGSFDLWSSLNVTLDPDKKQTLLSGQLTRFTCAACGHSAEVAHPLLYHDMERGMMIWLVPQEPGQPPAAPPEELPPVMTKEMKDYHFRAVADLNELREKVIVFEAGLDDRVVEMVKLIVFEQMPAERKPPGTEIYFAGLELDGADGNGDGKGAREGSEAQMSFAVLARGQSFGALVPKEPMYSRAQQTLRELGAAAATPAGHWPRVDARFAERMLGLPPAPPDPSAYPSSGRPAPPRSKPWWKLW